MWNETDDGEYRKVFNIGMNVMNTFTSFIFYVTDKILK